MSAILLSRGELLTHILQTEKPTLRQMKAWLVCWDGCAVVFETPLGVWDLLHWRPLRSGMQRVKGSQQPFLKKSEFSLSDPVTVLMSQ